MNHIKKGSKKQAQVATEAVKKSTGDLSRFAGRRKKTDFSYLVDMFPEQFGDKVFYLQTEDEGGGEVATMIMNGWSPVQITEAMAQKEPALKMILANMSGGIAEGSIRIPVNPARGRGAEVYGVLMMKPKELYKVEELAADQAEIALTERAMRRGDASGIESYMPDIDGNGNSLIQGH